MDCWLPGTLCGLLKTSCCLEVTWSAAFRWEVYSFLSRWPGLCWESIPEQPLRSGGCVVISSQCRQRVLSWTGSGQASDGSAPLRQQVTWPNPPREAMKEKLPLPRCLSGLVYNTQSGKSCAAEAFRERMPFKKFQKWSAVHWGWGVGNKCFFRNSQCQHSNSVEECF